MAINIETKLTHHQQRDYDNYYYHEYWFHVLGTDNKYDAYWRASRHQSVLGIVNHASVVRIPNGFMVKFDTIEKG